MADNDMPHSAVDIWPTGIVRDDRTAVGRVHARNAGLTLPRESGP